MADTTDITKIGLNTVRFRLDGELVAHESSLEYDPAVTLRRHTSARTGTDVIGATVQGRPGRATVTIQQGDLPVLEKLLDIGVTAPRKAPGPGSVPDTHTAEFEDPNGVYASLFYYAVVVENVRPVTLDGAGGTGFIVELVVLRDANGDTHRWGPAS